MRALPVLETERLILRNLEDSDADALFTIFSDPQVMTYWHTPPWSVISDAQNYIAAAHQGMLVDEQYVFAIVDKHNHTLMGKCLLWQIVQSSQRAEIGFGLGVPFWGKGYIQEAGRALLEFAFKQMALNRIEAEIDPDNTGSAKALLRLGFEQEGHLRQRWIVDGHKSDSALYGLLREDWALNS
ncbi:GNAT family N-acetyltransferase [Bowmanella yangjiangensis]|uniref:GNAT family N-acetyltransferase n=1 Tax=Bowmanella yangjiangensis TaxID=2811230 RepID=A0ABS3D135_9ALTE|nr:GNAT family N-acetyltransferase [Bowmanella yangjiangensis]MBN7821604.1 GNAT family N-acetyltransferase [Bowmanella yangjiangensis]